MCIVYMKTTTCVHYNPVNCLYILYIQTEQPVGPYSVHQPDRDCSLDREHGEEADEERPLLSSGHRSYTGQTS